AARARPGAGRAARRHPPRRARRLPAPARAAQGAARARARQPARNRRPRGARAHSGRRALQRRRLPRRLRRPRDAAPLQGRGRAARPGASRDEIATYIPYIRGAGLEHVVSVLAPRGGEHHQILDSFEGVRADESTIATQLGAITDHVADAKEEAGYAGTAARL